MFSRLCQHIKAHNFFKFQYFANLLICFNPQPQLGVYIFTNSDLSMV